MPGNRLTPAERRLAGQIGAYESWSRTTDRAARTEPARRALAAKFEREVDPEGKLPEAERAKRAEFARKAHYKRLAMKSAQSRRGKAQPPPRDLQARIAELQAQVRRQAQAMHHAETLDHGGAVS